MDLGREGKGKVFCFKVRTELGVTVTTFCVRGTIREVLWLSRVLIVLDDGEFSVRCKIQETFSCISARVSGLK